MFLSFIVPIYNSEKYLEECLDSLVCQDILPEDYEIICVNDGSTDSSNNILKKYAKKYHNIKIKSQENKGVSVARNQGIIEAQGQYVWFIDSDDFIGKKILNELKEEAEKNDADIIQFGAYTFMDQLTSDEKESYANNSLPVKSYANNSFVTRELYKKDFLDKNKLLFPTDLQYAEDQVFISQALVLDPQIQRIEKAYYFYRYNQGSTITLNDEVAINKKLYSLHKAIFYFRKLYDRSPVRYKAAIADSLMSCFYLLIYTMCGLPSKRYTEMKKKLQNEGIFPYQRPKECTLKKTYMVNHESIVGKTFDFIYFHMNTNWGCKVIRKIRVVRKKFKELTKIINSIGITCI